MIDNDQDIKDGDGKVLLRGRVPAGAVDGRLKHNMAAEMANIKASIARMDVMMEAVAALPDEADDLIVTGGMWNKFKRLFKK